MLGVFKDIISFQKKMELDGYSLSKGHIKRINKQINALTIEERKENQSYIDVFISMKCRVEMEQLNCEIANLKNLLDSQCSDAEVILEQIDVLMKCFSIYELSTNEDITLKSREIMGLTNRVNKQLLCDAMCSKFRRALNEVIDNISSDKPYNIDKIISEAIMNLK